MQSVIRQHYPGLEYIVMDGGSYDGSLEIIQRWASELAYWESRPDRGQSDALSRGFSRSTGDIQGWLCSDDLLLPGAIQAVANYFDQNPDIEFIYGDAVWINSDGRFIRTKSEPGWSWLVSLFDHNYLPQPSCFWRRSLYERAGGLDVERHLTMDADLWLRFARITKPHHVKLFLSCMRSHEGQKTRARQSEARAEHASLVAREAGGVAVRMADFIRPAARTVRIASKAIIGGYWARPPAEIQLWLNTLRAGELK